MDELINTGLHDVLGIGGLDQVTRDLMGLPIRGGGLGIPQAVSIGKAAHLGCCLDVKNMVVNQLGEQSVQHFEEKFERRY